MGPLLATAAALGTLSAAPAPAIVGGHPAAATHAGSLALVVRSERGTSVECSGTLIGPRVVLTAAHCVAPEGRTDRLEVSLGRRRGSAAAFRSGVARVAVERGYRRSTLRHDVALLLLRRRSNGPLQRLRRSRIPAGSEVKLLGWGEHERLQLRVQGAARETAAVTEAPAACAEATLPLGVPFGAAEDGCAAGVGASGACHGDSGGPVLARDGFQAAVISHGDGNCATSVPTFYALLPLRWIHFWQARLTRSRGPG